MSDRKSSVRHRLIRNGAFVGLVGIVMMLLLPKLFDAGLRSQLKLFEGGEMFKNWLAFPLPVSTKFHFFHVLNPEEAMNGAKVKLREVGPFTFEQWRRKEVIEWGPQQETVKYYEYKKYLYKPDLSVGSWDEEIVTINPVVAGLAAVLDDTIKTVPLVPTVVSPFLYTVVSGVLMAHGHNLFLKTTPRQLLLGHRINIFDTVQAILEPLQVFGIKAEDLMPTEDMPNNAFGILNGKNDTRTGPFEMYTGMADQEKYGYIKSFKGDSKMNKWSSDECNKIVGTDGAQFPPFRSKSDRLPIFGADICRTLWLVYDKEDYFKGIPVWRMKLDPKLWEPPKVNPDNECYCMHKKRPDRCNVRGLIDLGGCLAGAPLVMTAPHFLNTEPNLAELVEGLKPDPAKHSFEVLFEPRVGAPVSALGRIQLSVRVEKTSFLRGFSEVRNAFIPFVWVEEGGGLDNFLAMVFKIALVYVVDGSQKLAFAMAFIGLLVALSAYVYGILCPSNRKRLYPRDEIHPRKMDDESVSMTSNEDDIPRERASRKAEPSIRDVIRTKFRQMTGMNGTLEEPDKAKDGPSNGQWRPYYVKRTRKQKPQVAFAEKSHSHGETSQNGPKSSPPPVEGSDKVTAGKSLVT